MKKNKKCTLLPAATTPQGTCCCCWYPGYLARSFLDADWMRSLLLPPPPPPLSLLKSSLELKEFASSSPYSWESEVVSPESWLRLVSEWPSPELALARGLPCPPPPPPAPPAPPPTGWPSVGELDDEKWLGSSRLSSEELS